MHERKCANFLVGLLLVTGTFVAVGSAHAQSGAQVTIHWNRVIRVSNTSASLQIATEPPLLRTSAIHNRLFEDLRGLGADYMRYILYFPQPKLVVAELDPPGNGKTSWDFSLIDPIMEDFMRAAAGHPVVVNFSTIPEWMFKTPKPVPYPSDPNQVDQDYSQGTQLRDPSMKEVADYYRRVVSWYTRGGFTDEYGRWHASGHHYKIDYWEFLNEIEYEHQMTPQVYTALYDAVVSAIREVAPRMKFVGLALADTSPYQAFVHEDPPYFQYFLNPKNHRPGIPLDMISYHFYAVPATDEPPEVWQFTFFDQADGFLEAVNYIESIRQKLSPRTRTDVDEIGTILPNPKILPRGVIPDLYWNLRGAMYAYVYAGLARLGIDIAAGSQFTEYPIEFPDFSLVDMKTGQPNANFWVIQLLRDNFGPGDKLVDTRLNLDSVSAQGWITHSGERKVLLINKRNKFITITIPGKGGGVEEFVDETTGYNPPGHSHLAENSVMLRPFAVAAVTLDGLERTGRQRH
jgi:hypothetical protein